MGLGMYVSPENKFTQGARLRDIERASDNHQDYDKMGGICLMLSIRWLLNCMEKDDAKQALDALGTTMINGRATFKQVAQQQKGYHSGIAGNDKQAFDTVKGLVAMASRNSATLNNISRPYKKHTEMKDSIARSTGLSLKQDLVLTYYNCTGGAHAVAVCATMERCYLFDPNYGMMVSDGDIDAPRFAGFVEAMHKNYGIANGNAYALTKV